RPLYPDVDRRRRVLPREQRAVKIGRYRRAERRQVRAQVRDGVHTHSEKFAVLVERQLRVRSMIAPVRVGEERFGAIRGPLDRTIYFLRGPREHRLFGVKENLRTEAAPD